MKEIHKIKNIYEGFTDNQLIIMATNNDALSTREQRDLLWKELFDRYFNKGRQFNIYLHLKGRFEYFAHTIHIELKNENVEVPERDLESFSSNLLEFITFIENHIKQNPDLTMEWSIHELSGLKDMVDKIRRINTLDVNLKQKLNIFIDNVNENRKKSLEEYKKKEVLALVLKESEDQLQVFKQEIKRISIGLSKLKRDDFFNLASELKLYYEEDQKKIIKHGLKKYKNDFIKDYKYESFDLIISGELFAGVDIYPVFSAILSQRGWYRSDRSKENDLLVIEKFLKRNLNDQLANKVLKHLCVYNNCYITDKFLEYNTEEIDFMTSYNCVYVSELLKNRLSVDKEQIYSITYSKDENKYIAALSTSPYGYPRETTQFNKIYEFVKLRKSLVFCERGVTIQKIDELFLEIKRKLYKLIIDKEVFTESLHYYDKKQIVSYVHEKTEKNLLVDSEKELLFTTLEGFKWFDKNIINNFDNPHSFGRAYKVYMDVHEDYLFDTLNLSDPIYRKIFFSWDCLRHEEEYYDLYYKKIKKELPHEFFIINNYYSSEDESDHEIFVYDEEYDETNPLIKMLFIIENKPIGELQTVKGVKLNGKIVDLSKAKIKAIVDYFVKAEKIVG